MRIFLSGIIQGSEAGKELHDQGYREQLKAILARLAPEAEVLCPIDLHPNGIAYSLDEARAAFFALVESAAAADLVVAYLPQASLGTAIELWEAHRRGTPVVTITPLRHNWVINLLSRQVCGSVEEFEQWASEGGLKALVPAS
ncbi:MAG: hypothetical protein ACYC4L_07205 [Chloroflexota bacterium]